MRCFLLWLTSYNLLAVIGVEVRLASSSLPLRQAAIAAVDIANKLKPCSGATPVTAVTAEDASLTASEHVLLRPVNGTMELTVVLDNPFNYTMPFRTPLNVSADRALATMAALHWDTAIFLTNARCAVALADQDTLSTILEAATTYNITLLRHGLGTAGSRSCLDFDLVHTMVYFWIPTDVPTAISVLLDLYRAGGLDYGHVLIFPSDLSSVTLEAISTGLQMSADRDAMAVQARLRAIVLTISSFTGLATAQTLHQQLATQAGLAQPALLTIEQFRMFDATLVAARLVQAAECQPTEAVTADTVTAVLQTQALTSVDLERTSSSAFLPMTTGVRESLPKQAEQLRLTFGLDTITYFDPQGVESWRPYLLLEDDPEHFPIALGPVPLDVVVTFGLTYPFLLQDVVPIEAFVRAAVGFFNARLPLIELRPAILDSYALGCDTVAQAAINQSAIAVVGAVLSECSILLNDNLNPVNVPSITPASTANILSNMDIYPNVVRLTSPSSEAGLILMRLLRQADFDCLTLVEATQQASLEASASIQTFATANDISITRVFSMASSSPSTEIEEMLKEIWATGTGVIVLSIFDADVTRLFQVAHSIGMTQASFLWLVHAGGGGPQSWPEEVLAPLNNKVFVARPDSPSFTTPLALDYFAFDSGNQHASYQALARNRALIPMFAEALNLLATTTNPRVHSYGFGWNTSATRALVLQGLKSLTTTPVEGIASPTVQLDSNLDVIVPSLAYALINRTLVPVSNLATEDGGVLRNAVDLSPFSCEGPASPFVEEEPADSTSRGSQNTGLVVGLIVTLLLCFLIVFLVVYRLHKQRGQPFDFTEMVQQLIVSMQRAPLKPPMELNPSSVKAGDTIGAGLFGSVVEGTLGSGSGLRKSNHTAVALKTCKAADPMSQRTFLFEACVLAQFAEEPHVVRLLGVVTTRQPLWLVMEMCQDNLQHYLSEQFNAGEELGLATKLRFAKEVASGMKCLAAAGCVHRDLSCRNILITSDLVCKLSDFGMTRPSTSYTLPETHTLPVRWTAPEVLAHHVHTPSADVWAFGITFYEMLTNCVAMPYSSMSSAMVETVVLAGYRLQQPYGCADHLFAVCRACWQEANARPTFTTIAAHCAQLEEHHANNGSPSPQSSSHLDTALAPLSAITDSIPPTATEVNSRHNQNRQPHHYSSQPDPATLQQHAALLASLQKDHSHQPQTNGVVSASRLAGPPSTAGVATPTHTVYQPSPLPAMHAPMHAPTAYQPLSVVSQTRTEERRQNDPPANSNLLAMHLLPHSPSRQAGYVPASVQSHQSARSNNPAGLELHGLTTAHSSAV
eukprot:m.221511 g.221511  ORF g.221511 m.221511 type:complete len:1317 (+) comp17251_c1_seq2:103-4053(+)